MRDHTFPCKDCGTEFPTAVEFSEHIETCENNYDPTASLQLQNAAIFLRDWVRSTRMLTAKFKRTGKWLKPLETLEKHTVEWLIWNKLQGDLK